MKTFKMCSEFYCDHQVEIPLMLTHENYTELHVVVKSLYLCVAAVLLSIRPNFFTEPF